MEKTSIQNLKAALCVPEITENISQNIKMMEKMIKNSGENGASLVVFPETALTGLVNNDNPEHDYPFCHEAPGEITKRFGDLCRKYKIWLAFGLLEKENLKMFDTAVLIKPDGEVAMKYRRNDSHWHTKNADPAIYHQGIEIPKYQTPFGSVAFLICGDLFNDDVVSKFKSMKADWMIYLLAISTEKTVKSYQDYWDNEQSKYYSERVKMTETAVISTNNLAEDEEVEEGKYFGGAFVMSSEGGEIASFPANNEGILLVELEKLPDKKIKLISQTQIIFETSK